MSDECPRSPAPGYYEMDIPYGWELTKEKKEQTQAMNEYFPGEYEEDPVLKAMRLEAEAEQKAEQRAFRQSPDKVAKMMKEHMAGRRVLNFDKAAESQSVNSFETEDYMSAPSETLLETLGELRYIEAFQAKAKRAKKLRKLLSDAPTSFSPVKKAPSPKKKLPSFERQEAAIKKYAAALGATPKKFGDINLDSSDDDEVPLPSAFNKLKIAQAGKKAFFAPVEEPSTPIKSPSPAKAKAVAKKSFFANPISSDSDSDDIGIPSIKPYSPKKYALPKKSFFAAPGSPSPKKGSFTSAKEEFQIAALDSELHDRLKFLQKVSLGEKLYQATPILPSNVNTFLASRRGTASYLELCVDIESLIINAMITKIEAGHRFVNPNVILKDSMKKLQDKYASLAANLQAIGSM